MNVGFHIHFRECLRRTPYTFLVLGRKGKQNVISTTKRGVYSFE
ncbi:MAG: hypothetical protein ACI835_003545 [Planctomycetota bacterium]|jgi:hypothetical protein